MGNDNVFMVIIGVIIAYFYLSKSEDSNKTSSAISAACPRGARYSRGFFGDCDPNYVMSGLLDQDCECLSSTTIPASTYQEPAPRYEPSNYICPYDDTLLAGDRRCTRERMEEIKTLADYGFSVDGLTGSYDPATGKFVYIGN